MTFKYFSMHWTPRLQRHMTTLQEAMKDVMSVLHWSRELTIVVDFTEVVPLHFKFTVVVTDLLDLVVIDHHDEEVYWLSSGQVTTFHI